jgi:hypothetical protein
MRESARASPAAQLADSRFLVRLASRTGIGKRVVVRLNLVRSGRQDFEKLSNVGKPV